jgi:hypothetical protein
MKYFIDIKSVEQLGPMLGESKVKAVVVVAWIPSALAASVLQIPSAGPSAAYICDAATYHPPPLPDTKEGRAIGLSDF